MNLLRKILLLLIVTSSVSTLVAQPVKWSAEVRKGDNGVYTLVTTATIDDTFHIYDMNIPEGGPMPTSFDYTKNDGVELVGPTRQMVKPIKIYDDTFEMQIGYFEHRAVFEQDVRPLVPSVVIKATIEYMCCDDTGCSPSDIEMEYRIEAEEVATAAATKVTEEVTTEVEEEVAAAPTTTDSGNGETMWALILEAILWGLAALLTPCVFPMVPMTVSFFMKCSGSVARGRFNAAMYGLFIVLLYTAPIAIIILITRALGGDTVTADIFNFLATHWLPNIIFFAVFMIFAASFFGAFEITMPSSLVNKSDAKSEKDGLAGIFFMALTLVLVSFSCTGPIVGSVLIKSTAGQFWEPIITMLAFSLAFALPFTLFAFFPSMLKKLPKSGGWLNSVKVVLGFIEVALGFKFLSVADQTYHWGILDREVYLAIWIVVFALLGLYLLGKIRFAHDSEPKPLGVGRLAAAIAVFTFVVYMIPGMWGAPLKALSGYLPPLSTQDFVITRSTTADKTAETTNRKYSDILHLPHGLEGFFDLDEAKAYAEKVGKPLFIDFTGHGCVNCREMEARVWSDEEVLRLLRDEYVIVALYTDDKLQLPADEWVTTDSGKVLKSLGKINSHYALTRFGVNAQPYYVLQGRNDEVLVEPRGYNLDIAAFAEFLRKGIEAYKAH